MQEKFMKTIKKVAAIGTGIAMLGMTLTGATAVDLSNYPTGLGFGGSDTILVVGANAGDSASDNAAAADIAAGLPASGTTGGTNVIEGGQSVDIPLGANIAANNLFDTELTDDEIESLQDTKISFASTDYDIHEAIVLSGGKTNVSVQTSLSGAKAGSGIEDDYETNVFLEVGGSGAMSYYYMFDDAINISKSVSTSNPLKIKFLGKTLKVVSVDTTYTDTKFTAYVGNEYFLNQGESVVVNGKTVTLDNVGSGGAIAISVDGVKEVIAAANTETVNGIEITNDETFYTSAGKDQTAASLVVGKDSSSTIQNGDEYPGGDDICTNNDPEDPDCWDWAISGLGAGASTSITSNTTALTSIYTSGTVLGIKSDFIINDDGDNPPGLGDCVTFPNNFVSICLDSLTVPDSDYMNLKISVESSASFKDTYPELSGVPALKIKSSESEGLKIIQAKLDAGEKNRNITKDVKTDTVYLFGGDSTGVNNTMAVLYENENNQIRYAGNITGMANRSAGWMQINYKDTKSTNIIFALTAGPATSLTTKNLSIDVVGDGTDEMIANNTDDLIIGIGNAGGIITSIGSTANSEESSELVWGGDYPVVSWMTTLGTKDEDHRTAYGIIIRDPKSHGSSDEVELDIPGDQVKAKVTITGTVIQKAGEGVTNAAVKLDSEVSDVTAYNVILVGGPCANSLTAQLMGASSEWPACAEGFTDGEAIIELKPNGDKYAVIAAGYSADDTRKAGVVLQNYQEKLGSAVKTKNSVIVTGTGLQISGISVA